MPRPGPWMDRLRQFLAFPMYASAVWMVWVLTQQTGADGVIYALGGMILIAFAIWLLRLGSGASLALGCAAALAAAAVLLAFAAALKLEDGPATAASASGGPRRASISRAGSATRASASTEARGRQAGVRRFHRRLVHHLPGQRAGGARNAGRRATPLNRRAP